MLFIDESLYEVGPASESAQARHRAGDEEDELGDVNKQRRTVHFVF